MNTEIIIIYRKNSNYNKIIAQFMAFNNFTTYDVIVNGDIFSMTTTVKRLNIQNSSDILFFLKCEFIRKNNYFFIYTVKRSRLHFLRSLNCIHSIKICKCI